MPFLLTFWKPIAAVLLLVALVGALAFAKHGYDERRRSEGRAEVTAKWDAAIAAQKVREIAAAKEADEFQMRVEAKREADFKRLLAARTAELQTRLSALSIGPDLTVELRNAVRAANEQGARKPAEDPTPATGLAVAEWFDQVAKQYRACREQVIGWIKWDDERVTP